MRIARSSWYSCALLACLALALLPSPLSAQNAPQESSRYALVVGNSDYTGLNKLANPKNDAQDIGAALSNLGFDVDILVDADLEALEDGVLRLKENLSSDRGSIGFFFYAGHGVQSAGENYLIPVDARVPSESLLRTRAIPLQFVLDSLGESHNALNIVVLDACRDNPFSWARSGGRGLAIVAAPPPGSIIAYATSAGSVAQDGLGRNGVYTGELLKNLELPGLDIAEVFRRTGAAVQESTSGAQIPATYNQYFGLTSLAGEGNIPSDEESAAPYLPAFYEGASPEAKAAISKAEELTYSGSWLSAWQTLDEASPANSDPYVFAEKIHVAMNGYLYTDNYRNFSFADLPSDSDIVSARYADYADFQSFDFTPHEIAAAMEKSGAVFPSVLARELGDYYYEVQLLYPSAAGLDGWKEDAAAIESLAIKYYSIAHDDYILEKSGMMRYAELLVKQNRGKEAVDLLNEALQWEPDDWDIKYQLAESLVSAKMPEKALALLDGMVAQAPSPDAAREAHAKAIEVAFAEGQQADLERLLSAYETKYPSDWYAGIYRLKDQIRSNNLGAARKLADALAASFPKDQDVLGQILLAWLSYPQGIDAGYGFLDALIDVPPSDKVELATLHFYRAAYRFRVISTLSEASPAARGDSLDLIAADLDSAEATLKTVAPPEQTSAQGGTAAPASDGNAGSQSGGATNVEDLLAAIADFRAEIQKWAGTFAPR